MENDKFAVYADKLDHTIFCVGYRVVQKDLEGTLDAEALEGSRRTIWSAFWTN